MQLSRYSVSKRELATFLKFNFQITNLPNKQNTRVFPVTRSLSLSELFILSADSNLFICFLAGCAANRLFHICFSLIIRVEIFILWKMPTSFALSHVAQFFLESYASLTVTNDRNAHTLTPLTFSTDIPLNGYILRLSSYRARAH